MPISPKAIDAYLNRVTENLSWIKELTPLEVEAELQHINPPPRFTAPLRIDQKICFLLGVAYPEILLLTDLGLGKTVVSLELYSYFQSIGMIRRAIVFAPTNELVESWEDEVQKWGFPIQVAALRTGSSIKNWELVESLDGPGLIIGTYTGIGVMISELQERRGGKKKHRVPQLHLAQKLGQDVDAVFFDQSTCVSETKTLAFKVCHYYSKHAKVRFGLAGRAFGRDPGLIWGQLYLADHGKALGDKLPLFREAFYNKYFPKWGGIEFSLKKRLQPKLAEFIAASSLRYSVTECVTLPEKHYVKKVCEFPVENWTYYAKERDALFAAKGHFREVKNAFLRMRQISSGFVGFIDDDDGERTQIEFATNPKLNLLIDIVRELPEDRKCVIFYEYTWSGRKISEALTKEGLDHGWLWSGTKEWTPIKDAFDNDPGYRFLVANWRKASMGLNLQRGSYMIFYESPVGVIQRAESEGRIHRTGQQHRCFIYDLVMKDSVDENILDFHKTGGDLWRALVDDPQKALKRRRNKGQ